MYFHDFVLALVAFASELLGTISGFGSSTFFVPAASFFETFQFVLALTAILHCFSNTIKIILFRQHLNWALVFRYAAPFLIFTGIGAYLTNFIGAEKLESFLGLFLVFFASVSLLNVNKDLNVHKSLIPILNSASGFFTGFVGTGGALRGVVLSALNLPKFQFVAVSSAIDFSGDLLRASIYISNGYMDWRQWFYIPMLLIAAFLGAKFGGWVLGHISQRQFKKIVAVFILISGLAMVLK